VVRSRPAGVPTRQLRVFVVSVPSIGEVTPQPSCRRSRSEVAHLGDRSLLTAATYE
jgi:hypothetical protein